MENADRMNEALLANFRAIKNAWPQLREPSVDVAADWETPIPALANRVRVQGQGARDDAEGNGFIPSGILDMRVVMNLAEVYGASLGAGTRTLDWGVGCARMSRHIPTVLRASFVGVDVDPVNIAWCRANVTFGEYVTIEPRAPTKFEDRSVDLIYSHSVLTHLAENDQDFWLNELARICRGLMVLSIHGVYAAGMFPTWQNDPELLRLWLMSGFLDAPNPHPDIADVVDHEYYRDVHHSPAYVRSHWAEFVDVIDIVPGGFGILHDAVICRPRAHKGR